MRRHRVDTVEGAICALRASGLEIIAIQNGWILREMDYDGTYDELVCDSHRDLIEWARRQQAMQSQAKPNGESNQRRMSRKW